MEANGDPGKIHLSPTTKTILDLTETEKYNIKLRGRIHIKEKGYLETYWLIGKKEPRSSLEDEEFDSSHMVPIYVE